MERRAELQRYEKRVLSKEENVEKKVYISRDWQGDSK